MIGNYKPSVFLNSDTNVCILHSRGVISHESTNAYDRQTLDYYTLNLTNRGNCVTKETWIVNIRIDVQEREK